MSKKKSKEELTAHKDSSMEILSEYLTELSESDDSSEASKSDKLCYWLSEWVQYLKNEKTFQPNCLRRYKRGEIIKVNLGFNIGSEEGGLHYAVIVEKDNPLYSPVISIVPLTSLKPNKDPFKLPRGSVYLGTELFTSLNAKIAATHTHIKSEIQSLLIAIDAIDKETEALHELEGKVRQLEKENTLLERMSRESQKMKAGSIAIVSQITTISKMRIYDPKTNHDVLSGLKFSNENLNKIDKQLISLFTNSRLYD